MNTLDARRRLLGRNVYKKTTEGNPAIAQGSLARRYPGIEMQGWTEQNSYEGKNLLDLYSWESVDGNDAVWNIGSEKRVQLYVKDESVTLNENIYLYLKGTNADWIITKGTLSKSYAVSDEDHPALYMQPATKETAQAILSKYNIMVSEGGSEIPYEPYTGRQPSHSPDYPQEIGSAGNWNEETQKYEYGIELTGKNLLDIPDIESISVLGDIEIVVPCRFEHPVIVSMEDDTVQVTSSVWRIRVKTEDGTFNYLMDGTLPKTFQASSENPIIEITYRNVNITAGAYRNIQVEYGDTATAYEPYRLPQTVTLTSDRPLTKWDKLTKKNGQWGWVYKSGVKQLISDMQILKNLEGTYRVANFAEIDRNRLAESLSTHFIYKLSTKEYGNFWFDSVGTSLRFRMSQFNTAEEVKDWLQENEVYFAFPTTEETFVPLSETEQEQMNALHTYRPTTVLSNDVDCNMILTYKTKKSMGGDNPYGLEIGGISGGVGSEFETTNRIRTDYIPFYSPDGSRTYSIVGNPYNIANNHAYDQQKNVLGIYNIYTPPAGTWFIRISFSKPDNSDFTQEELNQLIRTFDIERS